MLINPRVDVAFKKIFGTEEKSQIARNLLLDGLKIESVAKNTGLDRETVLKIKNSLLSIV